jgi:hypothetical protein
MIDSTHADFEKEWLRRATETRPADRAAAEAAAARFYDCVGFLGPMQSVLWVNSFPELACMVRFMNRELGWHVLYSFLEGSQFVEPDSTGFGAALADAFSSFERLAVENRIVYKEDFEIEEDDEENEEIEDVPVRVSLKALLPHIYAPTRLADLQGRMAAGSIPKTGMQQAMLDILRQCPAFVPLPGVALLCENPARITPFGTSTADGAVPGLIFEFRSGLTERFWHGIRVTKSVARQVDRPDLLTCCEVLEDFAPEIRAHLVAELGARTVARGAGAASVLNLTDMELRRQLIEAYGPKDLIFDSEVYPRTVNDDFGTLFRVKVSEDEDICVVKVLNATPELDGTFRDYFLRVPPNLQTPQEAVAWTFEIEEGYAPVAQT